MGANVTFLGEPVAKDLLLLGREQVVKGGSVWVLQEGRAAPKPVKILGENPLGYAVEGLAPDEPLLVVPADFKLEPGRAVKVKER